MRKRPHIREACPKLGVRGWRSTDGTKTSNEVRFILFLLTTSDQTKEGITAANERRDDAPKGLGDFQRRSNRDRDGGWGGRRDNGRDQPQNGRGWDATPRSVRGNGDAPSVRVPNVGWDSTPRRPGDENSGWGSANNRLWDAPTPRNVRAGSPDEAFGLDAREWEEEQVRLDRDWYTGAEEGGVAGDEENNPLAQYEDLSALKSAEIATKQVVRNLPHILVLCC